MSRVRIGCSGWMYDDWQAPHRPDDRRRAVLRTAGAAARGAPARLHTIEFRHPSWFADEVSGGNYWATELEQWPRRIAQWRRQGDVHAYFNNDWNGFAPANALALARRLR